MQGVESRNVENIINYHLITVVSKPMKYSKILILRPPLGLSKSGLKDHFWTVPKVVSNQRYTGLKNEEKIT